MPSQLRQPQGPITDELDDLVAAPVDAPVIVKRLSGGVDRARSGQSGSTKSTPLSWSPWIPRPPVSIICALSWWVSRCPPLRERPVTFPLPTTTWAPRSSLSLSLCLRVSSLIWKIPHSQSGSKFKIRYERAGPTWHQTARHRLRHHA